MIIECTIWTASSEFVTYRLCEQRRFRRACASAQSRQNLRCSLIQAVSQEEPSDRKPDPWALWMAGHAQVEFVMTECWKTQIRLTGPIYFIIPKLLSGKNCYVNGAGEEDDFDKLLTIMPTTDTALIRVLQKLWTCSHWPTAVCRASEHPEFHTH